MLFDLDLIDLFYKCKDSNIGNYVDDTAPYTCGENIWTVISELQTLTFRLFKCFENKHMKASTEKSFILLNNKKTEKLKINDVALISSVEKKLLGVTLNSELKFEKHITGILTKSVKTLGTNNGLGDRFKSRHKRVQCFFIVLTI